MIMLVMLPMWMNFLLRTYAWMTLLEDNGLINSMLAAVGLPRIHMINTAGRSGARHGVQLHPVHDPAAFTLCSPKSTTA